MKNLNDNFKQVQGAFKQIQYFIPQDTDCQDEKFNNHRQKLT